MTNKNENERIMWGNRKPFKLLNRNPILYASLHVITSYKFLQKRNVAPPPTQSPSENIKTKKWQTGICFLFFFFLEKPQPKIWKKLFTELTNLWCENKQKSNRKIRPLKSKILLKVKKKLPLYFLQKQNVTHKTQYYNKEKTTLIKENPI